MNKGVKQIRKSISKRKRNQPSSTGKMKTTFDKQRQLSAFLPNEEEKHGYYPSSIPPTSGSSNRNIKSPLFSGLMLKGILSVILFTGTAILWQQVNDHSQFSKLKQWTSVAMTKEFPFAKVNQVYKETFGSPFSFRTQTPSKTASTKGSTIPVIGHVNETFEQNGHGVMIAPSESDKVTSFKDGIVIFAGNDKNTKRTVVVQHADNSQTTYGHLSDIKVHLYQYVQKDEQLAKSGTGKNGKEVYFSIQKNNEYVDPLPVLKVDDNS